MKNVAPKARSFDNESPLTAAAIACSRMPKCRFLPPGVPGSKSPAPSNIKVVLVDGLRSADPPSSQGMFCASTLSTLPEASRPAMPLGSAGKPGSPSGRQLTPLHQVDLGRELRIFRPVSREQLSPTAAGLRAARANSGGEVVAHGVGNQELGVLGPSVVAFGEANLLLTQRLAVSRGGILFMRRAVADVAVQNDEGRAPLGVAKDVQGVLDAVDVIGVAHAQNVPPVTQEPRRDVLGKGDARVAFDRDVVVVVDPAEVVQAEMARQRRRFRPDAFHHAAITANGINVVAEDLEAGPIVAV